MNPTEPDASGKTFLRVVQFSMALSFAVMAGFLYSVKEVNPAVRLEFGLTSVLAFVLVGVAVWMFWQPWINGNLERSRRRQRLVALGTTLVMLMGLVLATVRALHGHARVADVVHGTIMAFLVLGFVGFLIWRVGRAIDSDEPPPGYR